MEVTLWIVVVLILVFIGFNPVTHWKFRKIPGNTGYWLLGDALELRGDLYKYFNKMGKKYGGIYKIWLGQKVLINISDADIIKQISQKSSLRPDFREIVGAQVYNRQFDQKGIFESNGETNKNLRETMSQAFTYRSLVNYCEDFNVSSDQLVADLVTEQKSGEYFNIYNKLSLNALDVLFRTGYGFSIKGHSDQGITDVISNLQKGFEGYSSSFTNKNGWAGPATFIFPFLTWPIRLLAENIIPDYHVTVYKRSQKVIFNATIQLMQFMTQHTVASQEAADPHSQFIGSKQLKVDQRQDNINGRLNNGQKPDLKFTSDFNKLLDRRPDKVGKLNFLDLVLQASKLESSNRVDIEKVASNLNVINYAGHVTTSMMLSLAVYEISKNKDIERRLLQEIQNNQTGNFVDYQQSSKYKYIEAILKEVLRLYTPVLLTPRTYNKDYQIGEILIPKGSVVLFNIYELHRNEKFWPQPLSFIPDRFMDKNEFSQKSPYAWIPFGFGQRHCLAHKFSIAEGIITLVKLYQNYHFNLKEGQDQIYLEPSLTRYPVGGINVQCQKRQSSVV